MTGVADKGSGALERGGAKVGIPGELLDSPSFLPFSPLTFGIIHQTNKHIENTEENSIEFQINFASKRRGSIGLLEDFQKKKTSNQKTHQRLPMLKLMGFFSLTSFGSEPCLSSPAILASISAFFLWISWAWVEIFRSLGLSALDYLS